MRRLLAVIPFVLFNLIVFAETLKPVVCFPDLNRSFFSDSGDQVFIERWNEGKRECYLFDARETGDPARAIFSLKSLESNFPRYFSGTHYFEKTFYTVKDGENVEPALLVYHVSNPNQPELIQTFPGIKHIPSMSNKWAISRYPEEPSILYRRDGQGKLEYVKELDLPAYLNSSFFPYDENTFFVSAYGNLLIELKIADGGETFIRWIPLGFQPYVGYSACLPMLYDFARMGDNLIVACCGACVDSSPPDDFVPDKVDVPITWEYPQGAIVFVNRVQDATPEIIMPNVNLDRFEDGSFAFESAQDIAVYREFIAVIQFDELRIWKRVGDAMEIVQRMNKQGHFSLAVSGHWLLACNYNGLDVYDLSQLKSPVDCWEFY